MGWDARRRFDMLNLGKLKGAVLIANVVLWTGALAHGGGFTLVGTFLVDASPRGVALGDLNGDGKLDLVVASYQSNQTVSVLLGNGDGTFQPQVRYSVGSGPFAAGIADVNLDGTL